MMYEHCSQERDMNLSLDSHISGKIGIDNSLCHPLRSISWWALVVIDIVAVAMAWRNHGDQRFDLVLLTLINIAMLGMFFRLRTAIYQLAAGLTDEQTKNLRRIAEAGLSIAGGVAVATVLFALR
jgi:hypothetical protein